MFIQTYLYGEPNPRNEQKVLRKIQEFAEDKLKIKIENLPHIEVLVEEMPTNQMPSLYKNFDVFVLPTRGEGWGLPVVEAMAMEYSYHGFPSINFL